MGLAKSYTAPRVAVIAFGIAGVMSRGAHAQLIQQYFPADIPGYATGFSPSVTDRMDLQEQAEGVEVGDFVVKPSLAESVGYDSNTLGASHSGSSEIDSNAALRINSDWDRDAIGGSFSVDDHRYLALPSASFRNWTAGLGGALNLGNDTATLAYSHLALNLTATDLGVFGIQAPVPYSVDDVRASYLRLFGRFSLTPSFEFENFSFGQSHGTIHVNYDSLNHQSESGALMARYEFSPGDSAVETLRVSQAQFSIAPSSNYSDIQELLGLEFRGDGVIQYRALGGIEHRKFSQAGAKTLNTPTFELEAVWTPTELDTVTLTGTRQLDDPTSPFAAGSTATDGRVELDHELRTNVFVLVNAEAGHSDARPSVTGLNSINQTEFAFGASAIWDLNRNLRGTLTYGYNSRMTENKATPLSAAGSGNFTSNIIWLGVSIFE